MESVHSVKGPVGRLTAMPLNRKLRLVFGIALLLLLALLPVYTSTYILEVMTLVLITTIFLYALDFLIGRTGLFSVAHGALYGIGAYTTAILTVNDHWTFWATVPVAIVVTAVLGGIVGLLTLRLSGHYFVIACLGFAIIIDQVLQDWTALTNGTLGLAPVPQPTLFGLTASGAPNGFYWLMLVITLIVASGVWLVIRSTTGMRLSAIRENVPLAAALGVDTYRTRVVSMTLSSALAGFAGCFQAAYVIAIDPSVGAYLVGFEAGIAVIVGGQGTLIGPFIGALFLIGLPQLAGIAQSWDLVMFGGALIVVILVAPDGVWGRVQSAAGWIYRRLAQDHVHAASPPGDPGLPEQALVYAPEDQS